MALPKLMQDVWDNSLDKLTPMMRTYFDIKKEHDDCILFYRLGDFYEMFFDDAVIGSKEMELTLTGKNCGLEDRAPMCGVPFHSVEGYINKLVSKGYKACIVEQTEDPAQAKGLVKREVVRIVTPGTNLDVNALDEGKNNYISSIVYLGDAYGISICDVTTGDFYVTEVFSAKDMLDEINKFNPTEIICNTPYLAQGIDANSLDYLKNRMNISIFELDSWYFDYDTCENTIKKHFSVSTLDGLGLGYSKPYVFASGSLLKYLYETQMTSLSHILTIKPYTTATFMILDSATRRNLELTETMRDKQKKGSLLGVLDKTKTAMGARLLRNYVEQPLVNKKEILMRQEVIEELNNSLITRDELREYLAPIYDLERLLGKISYRSANPRDLIAFRTSLQMVPHIKNIIKDFKSPLFGIIHDNLDTLDDITSLIENAIADEPPITIRDGGIIREGFNEEIDRLRSSKTDGKKWLAELETREKEKNNITTLKVKYNKVFGYFIEVSKSFIDKVPDYYHRKQTLVNAERYTTDELKELEDVILGAEDKLFSLEYNLFTSVRETIYEQISRIKQTAQAVAMIDVFASLAYVAERNNYVKPNINRNGVLNIKDGRHPVVEQMLSDNMFVCNNTYLDNDEHRLSIITGPNMAGKSTYMRQTALIVLMAQIGSFIPAKSADISICDKIFTRVGASDDLSSGQSTFMVEMTEVANILRNATKDSLVILDEIGRGTSTFDGLSIAWAVAEYISNKDILGAKTLFATHYHELTELEGSLPGVHNYCISVKEQGEDVVFLRKIIPGGADKSYGIQVAKLAGVPKAVLDRANVLVAQLSNADIAKKAKDIAANASSEAISAEDVNVQLTLFDDSSFLNNTSVYEEEIKKLDLSSMSPVECLNYLFELQKRIKGE